MVFFSFLPPSFLLYRLNNDMTENAPHSGSARLFLILSLKLDFSCNFASESETTNYFHPCTVTVADRCLQQLKLEGRRCQWKSREEKKYESLCLSVRARARAYVHAHARFAGAVLDDSATNALRTLLGFTEAHRQKNGLLMRGEHSSH